MYMQKYIPKDLKRFLHPDPKNTSYAPHKWTVPEYGQIYQYEKGSDNAPPLDEKFTKYIQSKFGSLL